MAYKGVAFAAFAPGTYTDGQMPAYSGGKIFTELCRANITYNRAGAKLYSNNRLHMTDNSVTGGSVSIDVSSLDTDAKVDVLGYESKTQGEDTFLEVTDAESPVGGFGYVETEEWDDGSDKYIANIVYKTQFGLNSKDVSTKGESTDFATPTLEGDFMGIINDASMRRKFVAEKACDTEAEAVAFVKKILNIQ